LNWRGSHNFRQN